MTPEGQRRNKQPDLLSSDNRFYSDMSTSELLKKTILHTAEYMRLQLELRRARKVRGFRAYSSQPVTDEIKSFVLSPEDARFSSDYGHITDLLFTLPEKAETSPGPGEVGLYGKNPVAGQKEKQIGIIRHVPEQSEQDLVVLNNGVVLLIGANKDKEFDVRDSYRQRLRPTIVPGITYRKDNTITDESVSAVISMFDYHMQAEVLFSSENPEDRDRLFPLIVNTFLPQSTFISDLVAEVTAADSAVSLARAAELFVHDAELDAHNRSKTGNRPEPPLQQAA